MSLYPKQGDHPDKLLAVSDGCQQLAVKAAEAGEGLLGTLLLDRVRVDLQRLALQGQHEDAPAL